MCQEMRQMLLLTHSNSYLFQYLSLLILVAKKLRIGWINEKQNSWFVISLSQNTKNAKLTKQLVIGQSKYVAAYILVLHLVAVAKYLWPEVVCWIIWSWSWSSSCSCCCCSRTSRRPATREAPMTIDCLRASGFLSRTSWTQLAGKIPVLPRRMPSNIPESVDPVTEVKILKVLV